MKLNSNSVVVIRMLACSSIALTVAIAEPPRPLEPAKRGGPMPRNVSVPPGPPQQGDPLPGLNPNELSLFGEGLDEFEGVEAAESGLGPIFNNVSCVACHNSGGTGGGSAILVTRFGRAAGGKFDPLAALGGSLLQDNAIDPAVQEIIPAEANVVAGRQSTALFGVGLIEAIPDEAILRNATRTSIDGIRGKAAIVKDVASGVSRVGRFGWKCQQATLLSFSADAYLNEMGITSRFFPQENAPNGNLNLLAEYDKVADPEDAINPDTGRSDVDASANFMRFLAPPQPLQLSPSASNGRQVFQAINCAVCHMPSMNTGPNAVRALDRKPVFLYSDLLLHDMGSLGDGIVQAAAGPREFRTAPLWGLRSSAPYLHDGRAPNVDQAIRLHDGEAKISRDRYLRLNATQRQQLLDFLKSL